MIAMPRRHVWYSLLALSVLVAAIFSLGRAAPVPPTPPSSDAASARGALGTSTAPAPRPQPAALAELYPVVRVIDGDTIKILYKGATTTVRLIGVDTPETVKPNTPVQCYGPESSAKMHALLDGEKVAIETDSTQDLHDMYGRLLAYVFLPDGTSVDELLIEQGYGREYTFKDRAYEYQAQFKQAERDAQAALRGLWGVCK